MHHFSLSSLTWMTISTALDKLDLKPYNLMRRCKRTIALECFSFKKPLKPRKRATKAKYAFRCCRNIFVSSTKRWIRSREKGLSKNRSIPYTSYRNTPEDLQLLEQKFHYCTTAGNFRFSIVYTKKPQTKFLFWLCLLLWNVSDYLIILWYDALEQDPVLFYNCGII